MVFPFVPRIVTRISGSRLLRLVQEALVDKDLVHGGCHGCTGLDPPRQPASLLPLDRPPESVPRGNVAASGEGHGGWGEGVLAPRPPGVFGPRLWAGEVVDPSGLY